MNKDLTLADLLQFIRKNITVSIITGLFFSVITYFASSSMAVTAYNYSLSYEVVVAWENVELSPSGALTAADFAENQLTAIKPRMKGSELLNDVIKQAGYEGVLNTGHMTGMISLTSEENVPIININFSGPNAAIVERLAHTYSDLAPKYIQKEYCSIEPFEPVRYAGSNSTPVKSYTMTAFILGALGTIVILYFIESLDTRVKTAAEIERKYEIANLGIIPNFYLSKKSSYSQYGYKKGADKGYE